MKGFKLITIFLGIVLWVLGFHAAAFANSNSTKINKSNVGKEMRYVKPNHGGTFDGSGKRATAVQGVAGTNPVHAAQPKSVYKSPAAPLYKPPGAPLYKPPAASPVKTVNHIKVPSPSRSGSSLSSSSSRSFGSKPYSSSSSRK